MSSLPLRGPRVRAVLIAMPLALVLAFSARSARAQTETDAATDSARIAAADSAARAAARVRNRASWISDRVPIATGDLITVVVDEQTAARERVSRVAIGNRSQRADLRTKLGDTDNSYSIGSSVNGDSRDVGEANRLGDLTAVLTVRVIALHENGVADIEGAKKVTVDGRLQEITLKGQVRSQDVTAMNTVLSSRIADAVITYKGKKIGPRNGIIGKILAMLWP